ncbi:uncharacterized protein LOC128236022 isoform X1 [Mya arenaria]|uniref:uncharacterized protein LOC128236022 isoform X1 n=1 Tax=Mya arenaria TaxID=6604 RepID=UPI0022E56F7A|nr:uncharacterized protein LOC128236022 isoform X1 [Mya arenaria]
MRTLKHRGSGFLPKIICTTENGDIQEEIMNRRRSSTYKGDVLQIRLLQMEPKYRSHFLYEQIRSFEDKVYMSFDQFNVDVLYRMFTALAKKTVVDVRKIKTLANLRKCFMDLKKLISCKKLHRHVEQTAEEHKLVSYFTWFFQYLDYLRHLRDNFIDRIFSPLFRYFYNIGYDIQERDSFEDVEIATHRSSVMSFRSLDSSFSALSGMSALCTDSDRLSASLSARSSMDQTQEARKKMVTRNALIALSHEFKDIKNLYDTSEIEKLAQRLSHLKDRTDQLLDKEKSLDPVLPCQDSERSVFHLKIKEAGSYNLMRLIPDILIKFQKAAWLARRWLEFDDQTTKDLNERLNKLTSLEEQMNRRLSSISKEIQLGETQLDEQANMLSTLLQREDKASNLGENIYLLKRNKDQLEERLGVLQSERAQLGEKLTLAAEQKDKKTYRQIKPLYERNKLQRFAIQRQIDTLNFRINLIESDMKLELELKTEVIQSTNDVQEKCEELEKTLEKARKQQKALLTALIPITKDRKYINEQMQIQDDDFPVFEAEFIGSKETKPMSSLDTHIKQNTGDAPVSVYITSIPTSRASSTLNTVSSLRPSVKPKTRLPTVTTAKLVTEVADSEW